MHSNSPWAAASMRGVCSRALTGSTSAPWARRTSTEVGAPQSPTAASCKGVLPQESRALRSAPAWIRCSSVSRTTEVSRPPFPSPCQQAACSGVPKSECEALTFAPCRRMRRTASGFIQVPEKRPSSASTTSCRFGPGGSFSRKKTATSKRSSSKAASMGSVPQMPLMGLTPVSQRRSAISTVAASPGRSFRRRSSEEESSPPRGVEHTRCIRIRRPERGKSPRRFLRPVV